MTPAKRSSGASTKRGAADASTKRRASKATRERPAGKTRAAGAESAQSGGSPASGRRSSLEERLDELQPWQRWHEKGPQATGLGRMQQWVSAYAEGTLETGEGDSPGPCGVVTG